MKEYKNQLKYFENVSLFKLNEGKGSVHHKKYKNLVEPILNKHQSTANINTPHVGPGMGFGRNLHRKIEDDHPKLLSELNDSQSNIPAYKRFQDEND